MTREVPFWPAAMPLFQAAAYCGISVDTFKIVCPVKPLSFTQSTRGDRYLRSRLDEWMDSLDTNRSKSSLKLFEDMLDGGKGEAFRA
jgi:hypothetical protein